MNNVIRFTAADRDAIRKHVIGKPTGVIATIGGLDFNLIPATTEQAGTIFEILDAITPLWNSANAAGEVTAAKTSWASIIGKEGKRTRDVLRSVLHDAAIANDLIDESDGGEEVFTEWFNRLPLADTLKTLYPKFAEAQGLATLMGNDSPPTASETAGETTNP